MYHANATVDALMKRGYLYLEDHEWKSAKGYFDDALDVDPENAQAYIGMLLAEMHIERECDLHTAERSFVENYYYKKALRFADDDYQVKLQQYHLDNIYYQANMLFEAAKSEDEYKSAAAEPHAITDTLMEIRYPAILPWRAHGIGAFQKGFVDGHLGIFGLGAEHTRQFPVKVTAELLNQKGIFLFFRPHRNHFHDNNS